MPRKSGSRLFWIALLLMVLAYRLALAAIVGDGVAAQVQAMPQVREPLPFRIVSFHLGNVEGHISKPLIQRAADLGFNGVMIQLEGSTTRTLREFAERNRQHDFVGFCHQLGMKITLWVHELSDIPGEDTEEYLGPVSEKNDRLWEYIAARYEWLFGELLPDIDGIVLTVVETQINATNTPVMLRLAGVLDAACRKHGKMLIVRTFTWHPEELAAVLRCIRRLPEDVVVMTKCVPQDWQMRGIHDHAIGRVGRRTQIVEYDVAGEYFLRDRVANCMPHLLFRQFEYGLSKNMDGVCVRVDRGDADVLHHPAEVNLWTLGLLAVGKANTVDEVWNAWATARFGSDAAPLVVAALRPTQTVVTELLNVGSFSFGDTRSFPPNGDRDAFHTNWANWRWDPRFVPEYERARTGDPAYVAEVRRQKVRAAKLAQESLEALERARPHLPEVEYEILRTKLWTNQVQLEWRAPMMLAYLAYRRLLVSKDDREREQLVQEIHGRLGAIRKVAERRYPQPRTIEHLGKIWRVGAPEDLDRKRMQEWVNRMSELAAEQMVLRHVVLFKWKDGTPPGKIREIETAFCQLPGQIKGIRAFEWGTDVSVEGKAKGFTHCFLLTFGTAADRDAYLPHPAHEAFRGLLRPHVDDVLVLDYWAKP